MCFRNLYSDFVFKGNRQYVHGTSIYDFLLENVDSNLDKYCK